MKRTSIATAAITAGLSLAVLAGCVQKPSNTDTAPPSAQSAAPSTDGAAAAVKTANPKGSVKVGDKAACAVCAASGGEHGPEEVKAVLDYQGSTYAFCSEAEKAEFISNPAKYARP